MTDELLYSKLAQHIADTGSPLPVLHGAHAGFLGVVYPILLAPFYGSLDPVAAYDAGHAVNAVLFASTAIPVFLLARRLVPRECALVVSLLVARDSMGREHRDVDVRGGRLSGIRVDGTRASRSAGAAVAEA